MHFQNIVVFPGTIEKLIEDGQKYAENAQYDLAVKCLEEALQYKEGDESTLMIYACALYETKAYKKAKAVCEELLSIGPTLYFEVMELYLTLCIQLKDFEQVQTLITTLLEEDAVPHEYIEKFERLKTLSSEIIEKLQHSTDEGDFFVNISEWEELELPSFKQHSTQQQMSLLSALAGGNIRLVQNKLVQIVEDPSIHPFVQSMALILLVEQQVDIEINICKFGYKQRVNASQLKLPTQCVQLQQIQQIVREQLQQQPMLLELVENLIMKHSIVTYPFEWFDYDAERVALSYIQYVQKMFGSTVEADDELIDFIQKLDEHAEL